MHAVVDWHSNKSKRTYFGRQGEQFRSSTRPYPVFRRFRTHPRDRPSEIRSGTRAGTKKLFTLHSNNINKERNWHSRSRMPKSKKPSCYIWWRIINLPHRLMKTETSRSSAQTIVPCCYCTLQPWTTINFARNPDLFLERMPPHLGGLW